MRTFPPERTLADPDLALGIAWALVAATCGFRVVAGFEQGWGMAYVPLAIGLAALAMLASEAIHWLTRPVEAETADAEVVPIGIEAAASEVTPRASVAGAGRAGSRS